MISFDLSVCLLKSHQIYNHDAQRDINYTVKSLQQRSRFGSAFFYLFHRIVSPKTLYTVTHMSPLITLQVLSIAEHIR